MTSKPCPICNDPANPFIGKCPHEMTYEKAKKLIGDGKDLRDVILWFIPIDNEKGKIERWKTEFVKGWLEGRVSLEPVVEGLIEMLEIYHQERVNHVDNNQTKGCGACRTISRAQKELEVG